MQPEHEIPATEEVKDEYGSSGIPFVKIKQLLTSGSLIKYPNESILQFTLKEAAFVLVKMYSSDETIVSSLFQELEIQLNEVFLNLCIMLLEKSPFYKMVQPKIIFAIFFVKSSTPQKNL